MTDIAIVEAIRELLSTGHFWVVVGLLIVGSVAFRIMKGDSLRHVLGFTNGYVKEKAFLAAIDDLKEVINLHHGNEGRRMDKHSREIGDLRDVVQHLDRTLAQVKTKVEMFEQYRNK